MIHNYLKRMNDSSEHWGVSLDGQGHVLMQLGDHEGDQVRVALTRQDAKDIMYALEAATRLIPAKAMFEEFPVKVFFASGDKGKDIRHYSDGSTVTRGFYRTTPMQGFFGPFTTRVAAEAALICQDCEDAEATKHDPRDPPLDTEICLCEDCNENAVEEVKMDLEDKLEALDED